VKTTRYFIVSIVIIAAILAYFIVLLTTNYRSQTTLQQTLLEQFRIENAGRATSLAEFFQERRADILNLASAQAIDVLYENRALGMSMEYGLKQSLPPIKQRFIGLIDHLRSKDERAFLQIELLDEKGTLLVQASAPGQIMKLPAGMKQLLGPQFRTDVVVADSGNHKILISTAYFFKEAYAGQIVAWLNPAYVTEAAMSAQGISERRLFLVTDTNDIYPSPGSLPIAEVQRHSGGLPIPMPQEAAGHGQTDMIGLSLPVANTPFSLVTVAPVRNVLGKLAPRGLLIGMAVLAAVILGGGFTLVRATTKSLVLQARLDTSLQHEQEVRAKNRALEKEITERRQAEEALERASREWRAAMDASDDMIYLLDLNRFIIRANKAFYVMTGHTQETAIGRHIAEIIHPKGEKILCLACQAQEDKRDAIVILEADHPDNPAARPIETTIRVVRDDQNRPISILMTLHDLTRERKAQKEKLDLEAQLHQAQKLDAIGQLAGGISHDFNNMLTAIIGYASLLDMKIETNSELKPFAEQILTVANKSADLTRQLLAFSRKQVISPLRTDLNALVRGVEKFLHRVIGEDIELRLHLWEREVTVMVDPGQMEQVMMNLCTNARDAMPHGGVLSIGTGISHSDANRANVYDLVKDGMYAMITVTDTGMGMDKKTRERIFEPFFTTKELGKGTGLGLSIVYGIIKQHNGHIKEYSRPGFGTTFTILLPLVEAGTEETQSQKTIAPLSGIETILVVEDNEHVRKFAKNVLEEYGYKVLEAVDGEDGVRMFAEHQEAIRLVILDLIMPRKNGKEAGQEIRKFRPDVKILFTSGYTADLLEQKDILEKKEHFMSKPMPPQELLARIREMLDRDRAT
jgi:PAS domain S-box-containing protein